MNQVKHGFNIPGQAIEGGRIEEIRFEEYDVLTFKVLRRKASLVADDTGHPVPII
jgi:hypothetical protein